MLHIILYMYINEERFICYLIELFQYLFLTVFRGVFIYHSVGMARKNPSNEGSGAGGSASYVTIVAWLSFWYFSSLVTLFSNKILLNECYVSVHSLGLIQINQM